MISTYKSLSYIIKVFINKKPFGRPKKALTGGGDLSNSLCSG